MTLPSETTRHLIAILTATLAILTAHRADTATAAPWHKHSWQEHPASHQTKLKPFTKQPDDDRIVSHDAPRFMLYYHCVRDIL